MRTFALLVITLACLTAPALALLPSPYIGANLQVNSPTGKFSQTDIVNKEGGAKTGVGGEVDLGVSTGSGEVYAGYRFGKNNAKATYNYPGGSSTAEGDWKLNRAVLGLRWHLLGGLPISPTIGGGITLGKTELNTDATVNNTTQTFSETSSNKMGWFLEAGGLVDVPGVPVSAVAAIQYHRFDAKFGPPYDGTVNIQFFTFQIGLRYSFLPV